MHIVRNVGVLSVSQNHQACSQLRVFAHAAPFAFLLELQRARWFSSFWWELWYTTFSKMLSLTFMSKVIPAAVCHVVLFHFLHNIYNYPPNHCVVCFLYNLLLTESFYIILKELT